MSQLKRGQLRITTDAAGAVVSLESNPCGHECSHNHDHKIGDVADWGNWGKTAVGKLFLASIEGDVQLWLPLERMN